MMIDQTEFAMRGHLSRRHTPQFIKAYAEYRRAFHRLLDVSLGEVEEVELPALVPHREGGDEVGVGL